jgi:hypothetical protein
MRLEPKAFAYGYIEPAFGLNLPFVTALTLSPFTVKAGLLLEANLAFDTAQVADGGYASDYVLKGSLVGSVEDQALTGLLGLFNITVAKLEAKLEYQIARSPEGTWVLPAPTAEGVPVTGTITLDDAEVNWLGVYNVAAIHVVRVEDDTGTTEVFPVETLPASSGQLTFEFEWVPGVGEVANPPTFAVLVETALLPWLDVELEKDSRRPVNIPDVRLVEQSAGTYADAFATGDGGRDEDSDRVEDTGTVSASATATFQGTQADATADASHSAVLTLDATEVYVVGLVLSADLATSAVMDDPLYGAVADAYADTHYSLNLDVLAQTTAHVSGSLDDGCSVIVAATRVDGGGAFVIDVELPPGGHDFSVDCSVDSGRFGSGVEAASMSVSLSFD